MEHPPLPPKKRWKAKISPPKPPSNTVSPNVRNNWTLARARPSTESTVSKWPGKNRGWKQWALSHSPRPKRKSRKKGEPGTPDKFQVISKRNWEGQVKAWRRRLHDWDLKGDEEASSLFLEDGELPQWRLDDDQYYDQFGGLEQWEAYMTENMRRKLDNMNLKELATGGASVKPKSGLKKGPSPLSQSEDKENIHRQETVHGNTQNSSTSTSNHPKILPEHREAPSKSTTPATEAYCSQEVSRVQSPEEGEDQETAVEV